MTYTLSSIIILVHVRRFLFYFLSLLRKTNLLINEWLRPLSKLWIDLEFFLLLRHCHGYDVGTHMAVKTVESAMDSRMEANSTIAFLHLHRPLSWTSNKLESTNIEPCFPCNIISPESSVMCESESTRAFRECEDFTFVACSGVTVLNGTVSPHLGCVELFVKGHKELHTCTLMLNVWGIIAGLCSTPDDACSHMDKHVWFWLLTGLFKALWTCGVSVTSKVWKCLCCLIRDSSCSLPLDFRCPAPYV